MLGVDDGVTVAVGATTRMSLLVPVMNSSAVSVAVTV
jgi:hypothetical protein